MAVRFRCQKCQQWLTASSRKRGKKARCPKCKNVVEVPTQEESESSKDEPSSKANKSMPVMIVYDDDPSYSVKVKPASPLLESAASQRDGDAYDHRRISISRRVVYIQAVLLVVVLAGAFMAGYFWNSNTAPTNEKPEIPANDPFEPSGSNDHSGSSLEEKKARIIQMAGKLSFVDSFGFRSPDSGAVLLAVPKNKLPESLLSIKGLRPQELDPTKDNVSSEASITELESQGGSYCRTNDEGQFQLKVQPGDYFVLVISHLASRPIDQSIDPDDLETMKRYFENPQQLIGQNKYRWLASGLSENTIIHIEFDKSGS